MRSRKAHDELLATEALQLAEEQPRGEDSRHLVPGMKANSLININSVLLFIPKKLPEL
jgi:hypothetical protein